MRLNVKTAFCVCCGKRKRKFADLSLYVRSKLLSFEIIVLKFLIETFEKLFPDLCSEALAEIDHQGGDKGCEDGDQDRQGEVFKIHNS